MSFDALAAIRDVEAPGASALLLLFILAEYAGPDGVCWPSQATLSERSKLSIRAVRDNLHALEEAGLIGQERRTRKNGERTSNRIHLLFYTPEQPAEFAASLSGRRMTAPAANSAGCLEQDGGDQRQETSSQPAAGADLTSLEPASEPITLSKRILDDAFSKWFAVYPRKSERANARRIFEIKVRGGALIDEMMAAAQRYAIECHGREERYVKNPTTWLHGECWHDETGSPQASEPQQGLSRNGFAGPADFRAAVVKERGEAWAGSWLDPCGWDADQRELTPRFSVARDRLREDLRRLLREHEITVGEPTRSIA